MSVSLLNASEECEPFSSIPTLLPLSLTMPEVGTTFAINVAYTLWTAREDGLAVSLSNVYIPSVLSSTASSGSVFYPEWQLRSGFKAGANLLLDYDGWDIGAEYTWFWNKHNRFTSVSASGTLSPTLFPASLDPIMDTASANWNNWFNRIDLDLGKGFYLGRYLSLRPFLGLVGAFERQSFDVEYSNSTFPSLTITENNTQQWWAVGPYTGFNTSYICNAGINNEFSFFLDGGFALTWAHYKTHNLSSTLPNLFLANVSNSLSSIDPMAELTLGMRWQNFWSPCCDNSSFLIQAAWEIQVWFNHNQMALMNKQSMNNYSMQGLTLKAQVTF